MKEWMCDSPTRLDTFLASDGRMPSRAKAQAAIEEGLVTVNGKVQKKTSTKLDIGDTVTLEGEVTARDVGITPIEIPMKILYEDDACLVIDKPAGISVHPGAGMKDDEPTLLHGLSFLFAKRSIPFSAQSVLVHRLDKETTGCVLIAKNADAHRMLQKQFETRTVQKTYLALVFGHLEHTSAKIDAPIGRSQTDRRKMSVVGIGKSRQAQTSYKVLAEAKGATLLECDLHTGRTHQVRVHLQSIGHPVLGDPRYASKQTQSFASDLGITSLCLHAWTLSFVSPEDGEKHTVTAKLPKAFEKVLEKIGIEV